MIGLITIHIRVFKYDYDDTETANINGALLADLVYSLALEQFHSLNQALDTPFQP